MSKQSEFRISILAFVCMVVGFGILSFTSPEWPRTIFTLVKLLALALVLISGVTYTFLLWHSARKRKDHKGDSEE